MSTMFRNRSGVDVMPSQIEAPSRIFGLSAGKTSFRSGLPSQDSIRPSAMFGSSNNDDFMSEQRHRSSVFQSTFGGRQFGLQLRNLTSHSSAIPESNFRLNQDLRQRSGSTTAVSKPFWPAVRNTTLTTGLQMQDSVRCNDDIVDKDGFRRPSALGIIRGRNSTLSSRLFHSQNTDRHYRDLSNINGFNVSHISRRDVDSLSESRLPLGMRSNWMENQSLSGSVLSVVSMKAQFLNLLENLHHSILSIGPHVNADAVRMEFDKAKQGLENISEMSFAPTIKPGDTASVVSQSSKYICPIINGESAVTNTIDGGSLHLKSGEDLLKTLMTSKNNYKRKFCLSTHVEEREDKDAVITSSQNKESDGEEDSGLIFKKPRTYISKRKTSRMKIKAPPVVQNLLSKEANRVINLKQWYPVAVGSKLTFCGVDEKGTSVETESVKKRLSNRKVELIGGIDCNLIGSPSEMVAALPLDIVRRLKNGLPDRWRVLQRDLLNCQTVEEANKRKPKNPTMKSPPMKETEKTPRGRPRKRINGAKVISTPKKKIGDHHTRSGRTVKRPGLFWLATGSNEISPSLELSETTVQESSKKNSRKRKKVPPAKKLKRATSVSPSKNKKRTNEESPNKEYRKANIESPSKKNKRTTIEGTPRMKQKETDEESPNRKAKASCATSPTKYKKAKRESPSKKYIKANKYSPSRKTKISGSCSLVKNKTASDSSKSTRKSPKVQSPKAKKRKENNDVTVHSSLEDAKQQSRYQWGKRKRELADADSIESKKSKLEKITKVESTVKSTSVTKRERKSKIRLSLSSPSPKFKVKKNPKSPVARNEKETSKKKTVKKALESHNETTEFTEFEKNFDFKLDDIEIPEIANISGNPQLSRSQLRLVSTETPPLKYFNSNLKLLGSTTPMRSPDWCISQRSESEVKQFQRRREEAFKKRIKMNVQKMVITEKNQKAQNRDVKSVMEWVSEKAVLSPQWNSKVLQYVIPSRKRMEEQEDDEDIDSEFF